MRFYVEKDYDALSQRAANIIAAQVISKPDCVLGLATGSSPVGTYKNLVAKYENGDLDFSQVKTANLDEYKGLPKDNDQSYYYFMHDHLFYFRNMCENHKLNFNVLIMPTINCHREYNDIDNRV